jgi:hypothetical protein
MNTSLPKILFTAGIAAASVLALGAPASATPDTAALASAKAVLDRVHDVPNTAWGHRPRHTSGRRHDLRRRARRRDGELA